VGQQTAELFKKVIRKTVKLNYLQYTPDGFSKKKKWPLVLFLHGAGERGNDLSKLVKHGPPKLVEAGKEFQFVLISPQCPEDSWWRTEALIALVDEVVETFPIDASRVYVTGLSMGGYGTWALAGDYPERFAAIAPICGGGTRQHARRIAQAQIPTWAFHGAKDKTVPIEESERLVAFVEKFGWSADFTIYPEAGHDSWTETYNNPKIFKWLLSHKNKHI